MKSVVCVLLFAVVVCGAPSSSPSSPSSSDQSQVDITTSIKAIQQVAHVAVVDALTPLHIALSSLQYHVNTLVDVAERNKVDLPKISMQKVDLSNLFQCQSESKSKTAILQSIIDKGSEIQTKLDTAQRLRNAVEYVIQMIDSHQQIESDTLKAAAIKINQFLEQYTQLVQQLKKETCSPQVSTPAQEMYMDTPLAIFYEDREAYLDCSGKDAGHPVCVKGREEDTREARLDCSGADAGNPVCVKGREIEDTREARLDCSGKDAGKPICVKGR